jgi:hypothetical protein
VWQIGAFIAAAEESVARHARGPRRNTEDTVRVMLIDEIAACRITCGGGELSVGRRMMQEVIGRATLQECDEIHLIVRVGPEQESMQCEYIKRWGWIKRGIRGGG